MAVVSSSQSNTRATQKTASEVVALPRLLWVAPLTIVLIVAVNAALYLVADTLFGVAWATFNLFSVIATTVAYLLVATVIFAIVARFSKRPLWLYRRIAVVALFLSFLPPVGAFLVMAAPPDAGVAPAPLDTFITIGG